MLLGQFSNQAGASAISHFGGKLPHGLLCDNATFTAGKRSTRFVQGRQKRYAAAFAFFPQGKRFLYGVLLAAEPTAFNGAAGECFLVGCKLHFHGMLLL
jgi:hypothetical protein